MSEPGEPAGVASRRRGVGIATDRAWRAALVASLIVHVGAVVRAGRMRVDAPAPTPPAALGPDRWSGDTVEIADDESGSSAAPEAPAAMPAPAAVAPPTVPRTVPTPAPPATSPPPATAAAPRAVQAPAPRAPSRRARRESGARSGTDASAAGASAASGSFGAEGEATVRDLVRAFTRAIPAASSADPGWNDVALGALGGCEVTLAIDAQGAIVDTTVAPGAPPMMARLVRRTVALLGGGRFGHGDAAAPARLRIDARVSPDATPAPAGATGGAYGLGFEPATAEHPARAWFVLPTGRRIDATVAPARAAR